MPHNKHNDSLLRRIVHVFCGFSLTARLLLIPVLVGGPLVTTATGSDNRLVCFASILPQAYFVERVGGEYVEVYVMVGPGHSPATYEPTTRQLTRLAQADVYFSIGVFFEVSLLPRVEQNFPDVPIIDTSRRIAFRSMEDPVQTDEKPASQANDGEDAHNHSKGMPDPHVWLSPRLAVTIAENIRDALVSLDSRHAAAYTANCDRLCAELADLDRRIAAHLSPLRGTEVFVFHPAFGYFTDAYDLVQVAVETGGSTPGPRHLAEVIARARQKGVATIFVQREFSATVAAAVAKEIGADIVQLDPLAEDYINNMMSMAEAIRVAFESGEAGDAFRKQQ